MNYNQFDHLGKEQANLYRDLCNVIEIHFGIKGDDAAWYAERLMSHGVLNGFSYSVFEGPKDIRALKRLDAALLEASRACSAAAITGAALLSFQKHLAFCPYSEKPNEKPEETFAYIEAQGSRNADAFSRITEDVATFRKAISNTIREIEANPHSKRSLSVVNVAAINLVDGCRFVWEIITKRPAPKKDLNPASKFANFLADTMKVCEVGDSPRSAFLAWSREQAKRP